ncbi:MAG: hypothetical protein P9M08_05680 [Candidatus Erginobacter occultus]|nr:hypothetical protein [Candidatus Erginobacter occultus]
MDNEKLSGRKGPTKNRASPENLLAKIKMFDSNIRPSGLLERMVGSRLFFEKIAVGTGAFEMKRMGVSRVD